MPPEALMCWEQVGAWAQAGRWRPFQARPTAALVSTPAAARRQRGVEPVVDTSAALQQEARRCPTHRVKLHSGHARKHVHDSRIPSLGCILLCRTTVDISNENVSPSVDESAHCFYVP